MGRVGLEPTTGGLWELRPHATYALPARIPRSHAAGDTSCTIWTGYLGPRTGPRL